MSWLDRLRPGLILTSPEGNVFEALWRGNARTLEKELGIFKFPKVRGVTVQDLDVRAWIFAFPFWFEGVDNDIEAERFAKAAEENGVWQIVHPVYGDRSWQMMNVTINDEPLESGNMTRIESQWIEPLDLAVLPSPAQLQGVLNASATDLAGTTADQLDLTAVQDTAAEASAFKGAVETVVGVFENTLQALADTSAAISAEITAIKRGIDASLLDPVLDFISIASQVQELIRLPGLAIEDVTSRVDSYSNFVNGVIGGVSHETVNTEGRNRVAVKELALVAGISSVTTISATGDLISRTQAVGAIEATLGLYNDIVESLDASQEAFEGTPITVQYFSQSTSFPVTTLLVAQGVALILTATFNLAVEKRFTLKKPRNPAEITITEYNDISSERLDFFISTNKLKNNDILILPAGREVVVYV